MPTLEEAKIAISADDSFPAQMGWLRSYMERVPVDAHGNPIPWYAYAIIDFLIRGRLNKSMTVFEYGCGHSTLWWASHCASVIAVDHLKPYIEIIGSKAPKTVQLILAEAEDAYVKAIGDKKFDIICVDGVEKWRDGTLVESLSHLNEAGVIILDNSQDGRYANGTSLIMNSGFKRIDFWGFTPICTVENSTTIFYRQNNCFNI